MIAARSDFDDIFPHNKDARVINRGSPNPCTWITPGFTFSQESILTHPLKPEAQIACLGREAKLRLEPFDRSFNVF
ncbi:hypothetical protein [Methyloversatilis sp.]|uniref:hypothetical protein n=1 Tax=Methyloversatilis sp. TaxID=2569862 RepID=UPI0035B4F7C9